MSKKSRTPPPPRPVQAPGERRGDQGRGAPGGRRRRLLLIGAIAAAVVVAAVIAAVVALGGSDSSLAAGGCAVTAYPSQGNAHISAAAPFEKDFRYNSFPPTSGPHIPTPGAPAIWNFYTEPIRQISLIHNLEHGGVVVQYGDRVPDGTVEQIRAWWQSDPNGLVIAPLPALGDRIAVTAWTQLLDCPGFSEEAFDEFRTRNLGKGPEQFPVQSLTPGSQ